MIKVSSQSSDFRPNPSAKRLLDSVVEFRVSNEFCEFHSSETTETLQNARCRGEIAACSIAFRFETIQSFKIATFSSLSLFCLLLRSFSAPLCIRNFSSPSSHFSMKFEEVEGHKRMEKRETRANKLHKTCYFSCIYASR